MRSDLFQDARFAGAVADGRENEAAPGADTGRTPLWELCCEWWSLGSLCERWTAFDAIASSRTREAQED